MQLHRARDKVVLPIFYGVEQSDVHNQESSFGLAFQDLINRVSYNEDEVSRWRIALLEVGGNYRFFVSNYESKNKSKVIQNIVKCVCNILDTRVSFVIDNGLVGVSSQVREVITMLQKHQSKNFASIGIWGMRGISKTTIARQIFEHVCYEFDHTCFLSNVKKAWEREGRFYLQQKLVAAICESTDIIVDEVEVAECQERAYHIKALVVLDDVNDLKQLLAFCGNHYGRGSRIIITTRDLHIFKAFQVDDVYSVKLLSDHESLKLFSREAFGQVSSKGEFIELSRRMVAYVEGLPLAFKYLGSFMAARSLIEWESALMRLSIILRHDICKILMFSFDSLDGNEKEIFLNVVLFYIGEDMDDVIQKLNGCGCDANVGIRVLVD